jgi:hypothetical protein
MNERRIVNNHDLGNQSFVIELNENSLCFELFDSIFSLFIAHGLHRVCNEIPYAIGPYWANVRTFWAIFFKLKYWARILVILLFLNILIIRFDLDRHNILTCETWSVIVILVWVALFWSRSNLLLSNQPLDKLHSSFWFDRVT